MGQKYFLKYCHAEFSSENPEYWLAVQEFKRASAEERTQYGVRVWHCFIKQNSKSFVNIPKVQASRIEDQLRECFDKRPPKEAPITLFDQSASHAYKSMNQDTYRRFKETALCDELVQLHIQQALKDEQATAFFRKFLSQQPDATTLIERYDNRLRLWADAVVGPAVAPKGEQDEKHVAALEWALDQNADGLGVGPEAVAEASRALKQHMRWKRDIWMREKAQEKAADKAAEPGTLDERPGPSAAPASAPAAAVDEGQDKPLVVRKSDGGSSARPDDDEEEEMEMAALLARADGVDEALMAVADVRLIKASAEQKIGIVITCGGEWDSPLHVSKLRPGGLAATCGQLRLGDRLLQVNGVEVDHPVTATDIMRAAPETVVLRIQRAPGEGGGEVLSVKDAPEAPQAAAASASAPIAAPPAARLPVVPGQRSTGDRATGELPPGSLDEVETMLAVKTTLLALATESLMSMEAHYLKFLNAKPGEQYCSRIRVKRAGPNKSGTPIKRPLEELGDAAMSMDDDDGADDGDYAAGW